MAHIATQFHWKSMQKEIAKYVKNCLICQQAKASNTLPAGLLQPLPIPNQIWDDIAMDFIMGLPASNGFTIILVVVEKLSKYAHFSTLKSSYTNTHVN